MGGVEFHGPKLPPQTCGVKYINRLDNDAEDARAAEAEEAQANAEEWAALQRTSAAAIITLLRERDEALGRFREVVDRATTELEDSFRMVAIARAAALEEAAMVAEQLAYTNKNTQFLGPEQNCLRVAAAIRALVKRAPCPDEEKL